MNKFKRRAASAPIFAALPVSAGVLALALATPSYAQTKGPIKIGVIAEAQAVAGSSIPQAAQLAADEINAAGGVDGRNIEIVSYDDHSSAVEAVRAFQRAANEDHVNAVIASYVSEVVLALEPWTGRLKTVMVTPGAASDIITQNIAKDYNNLKYTFHGYLTSTSLADSTCDAAKDLLVKDLHMKTAVVMSEDAAWTTPLDAEYLKCLPNIGLNVIDHIRVSPDTTDFTPIFNKIEGEKPDVMITGISHVGVQPTVQWKQQEVPIPMLGVASQATNSSFWNDTNGATEGVLYQGVSGPGVAVTPKTLPFVAAFQKRFGNTPSYCGYTAYDEVYYIADAIKRTGRLKTVMITPGAASDVITQNIAKDYDNLKYTFHGYLTSTSLADSVCAAAKDLLVNDLHMKSAVVMSEDAAWTTPLDAEYLKCLPDIGLKVVDHIRVSPDTTDFTPIFNKIEGEKPDVMITGIAHVGVQPTVQWKQQEVPIPMLGISSQATNSSFWNDTNGAVEGVLYQAVSGPDVAVTPKTLPFVEAFKKRFGNFPSYCGYTAYDEVYYIADAIKRAGSTDPDKLVDALEQTDYVGTIGRVQFKGKDSPNPHALKVGPGTITGLMLQWQNGKQVNLWPANVANGKLKFPPFIKLGSAD